MLINTYDEENKTTLYTIFLVWTPSSSSILPFYTNSFMVDWETTLDNATYNLAMTKNMIRKINSNSWNCLILCFVYCNCKAQMYRKLSSDDYKWQVYFLCCLQRDFWQENTCTHVLSSQNSSFDYVVKTSMTYQSCTIT